MARRLAIAMAAMLCFGLLPASAAADVDFRPGAPGIGDPYFPLDGNGGYDVEHYGLDVRYDPATDGLAGVATITARATHDLSQFNLDFVGLTIESIEVNRRVATWSRDEGELTVRPMRGIEDDDRFTVVIRYAGVPEPIVEGFGVSGFIHTDDGAMIVGQPHVAATWFPANDHPLDKAAFTFRLTVPEGLEAVANGSLTGQRTRDGWTTWTWDAPDPMAPYLAGVGIGQFDLLAYREQGIRYWDALDPDLDDELLGPPSVGEIGPLTGTHFAWSQITPDVPDGPAPSWKRLMRTISVPSGGATLSFATLRETEEFFDFLFVESHTVGEEDWTTHEAAPFTTQDTEACPTGDNPFLEHYMTPMFDEGDPEDPEDDVFSCPPTGSTGVWHARSGASDGWETWTVALPNAGPDPRSVEVAISYASDSSVQLRGVAIDDIVVSTGEGTTSFEDDGDVMDGWVAADPPAGSVAPNNWIVSDGADVPPPPPPSPSLGDIAEGALARQPEIIDFLAELYGRYPFKVGGGIVDDSDDIGFALETQTRPIYSKFFFFDPIGGDLVVVHELAHQWFGDSLAVGRWQDIWLNEGFATYAEWLWLEAEGIVTVDEIFTNNTTIPRDFEGWQILTGDPGPERMFDSFAVYTRGAMTLHALRLEIGDRDFFRLLRRWFSDQRGGHVTTPEFIETAERVSGEQLDDLFEIWLYTPEKPPGLPEPPPEEPEAMARSQVRATTAVGGKPGKAGWLVTGGSVAAPR